MTGSHQVFFVFGFVFVFVFFVNIKLLKCSSYLPVLWVCSHKEITWNYLCPLISDGRDLRDCTLPQDIKKFLGEVPDFSEELPGEDIFPMFHPYVTVSF